MDIELIVDIVERVIHILASFGVFGILWVEIDSTYGWTDLSKLSKRRWRRYWREFWDDSKRYARRKK